MTYVFELDSDLGDVIVDNLGTEIVEFTLGFDLDESQIIVMSVTLVPTDDGVCDLRFGIRDMDAIKTWKVSGLDYTQEKVKKCVPIYARSTVLGLILSAVDLLASTTKHNKITMETHYQHLDERAMGKYEKIRNCLINNDFPLEEAFRDTDGTDYWFFSRSDGST